MDTMKARPFPLPAVEAHEVLDEMALYLPDQEKMLSLNASARAIWELCDGTRTIVQIGQTLSDDLEAAKTQVPFDLLDDVQTVILQFQALGFVTLQGVETDEA